MIATEEIAPAALPPASLPKLTNEEIARYSRHLILPEVGMEGQQKLKAAKVLCVGTGGLGAPLALYLTAAGVGTIGLVDFDVVDESNLQRQIIHSQSTVGKLKVDSAEIMLNGLNKNVNVVKHNTMLTSANALEIFADYDVIADGTDNFQTRYLVNDACVLTGKPNAYGSIFRFEGQASVFATEDRPLLPLPLPRTPTARPRPLLRRRRRPRHPPRPRRRHPGHRSHQAHPGNRRASDRSPAPGRRPRHELPHPQAPQEPRPAPSAAPTPPKSRRSSTTTSSAASLRPRKSARWKSAATARPPTCPSSTASPSSPSKPSRPASTPPPTAVPAAPFLLDVREPHEYAIVNLGALQIPVGNLPDRASDIPVPKDAEIVVHCKSGARSQKASLALHAAGFTNVSNLAGGILAWADKIDPSMPKY